MSYGPFTTANYLATASTPVTGTPFSMLCWFYSTDITATQVLMSVQVLDSDSNFYHLSLRGAVAGDPIRANAQTSSAAFAETTTGFSANVWTAAAAVFASTTSRSVYINGGSKGTNTTSKAPSAANSIAIGVFNGATNSGPMLGQIAEPAIWNVALTDAEVLSHAAGTSPLQIRPQSLVFYSPLIRDLIDVRAGLTITMNGTVAVAAHPRVYG